MVCAVTPIAPVQFAGAITDVFDSFPVAAITTAPAADAAFTASCMNCMLSVQSPPPRLRLITFAGVALFGIGYAFVDEMGLHGHTFSSPEFLRALVFLAILNPLIAWLILKGTATAENARLSQETQHRYQAMVALHETSLDIIARLDTAQLLEALLRRGAQLLRAKAGMLYLYDPHTQLIHTAASYHTVRDWSGVMLHLGEGVIGQVIQSGQPLIVNDYFNWPGHAAAFENGTENHIVGVPLKWERQIIGGIFRQVGGGLLGGLARQATGSAFSFASTYALGHVAKQYYASGRTLTTAQLKQLFASLLTDAKSLQTQYAGDIAQKSRTINPSQILPLCKGC